MESLKEHKLGTWFSGSKLNILAALFVRCFFVLHSALAVWRVVIARDDAWLWCLIFANIPLFLETFMVIKFNGGNEWKWWCPCFLCYLISTLPAIWILQLSQNEKLHQAPVLLTNIALEPRFLVGNTTISPIGTDEGLTVTENVTNLTKGTQITITPGILESLDALFDIEDTTWIVLMQEALMYFIVLGRWVLPRAGVSRVALSDLLLIYLAMASDIMELYAVFDEQVVKEDRGVTYAILTIWSISFLQFIPVLVQKNKYRNLKSPKMRIITRVCGNHFSEVFTTIASILLQDGPFFCLRVYIMVRFSLVTYSLMFFVLKNAVSNALLIYRLVILCLRLPCRGLVDNRDVEKHSRSDFSLPLRYSDTFVETKGRYMSAPPGEAYFRRHRTAPPSPVFVVSTGKRKFIAQPVMENSQFSKHADIEPKQSI